MTVKKAMDSSQGRLREIEGRLTAEWRNADWIDVSRLMRCRKAQRRAPSRAPPAPVRNIKRSMRNASALHMLISIVSAHCLESPPSFPWARGTLRNFFFVAESLSSRASGLVRDVRPLLA
jgi:hypothetical protein